MQRRQTELSPSNRACDAGLEDGRAALAALASRSSGPVTSSRRGGASVASSTAAESHSTIVLSLDQSEKSRAEQKTSINARNTGFFFTIKRDVSTICQVEQ